MPIVLGLFCALPLGLGAALEYLSCRLPRRKAWRALPPALAVLFALLAGAGRLSLWETETVSQVTHLIIFPGLPAVFCLAGCWLGWRLWKRIWSPRVIR